MRLESTPTIINSNRDCPGTPREWKIQYSRVTVPHILGFPSYLSLTKVGGKPNYLSPGHGANDDRSLKSNCLKTYTL